MIFPHTEILVKSVNYGFILVKNLVEFDVDLCRWSTSSLTLCVETFLVNCDKNTELIYKPLQELMSYFCLAKETNIYNRHHKCFLTLYQTEFFHKKCLWQKIFYNLNLLEGEQEKVRTGLCRLRRQLSFCLSQIVFKKCGIEATKVQIQLFNAFMKRAFQDIHCGYTNYNFKKAKLIKFYNSAYHIETYPWCFLFLKQFIFSLFMTLK